MLWVFSRSASVLDIFMEKIEKYQKFLNEKKEKKKKRKTYLEKCYKTSTPLTTYVIWTKKRIIVSN